jgi:hypothetical protein
MYLMVTLISISALMSLIRIMNGLIQSILAGMLVRKPKVILVSIVSRQFADGGEVKNE